MWVEKFDPAGVREPRPTRENRYVEIGPSGPGMAGIWGNLAVTEGAALDDRLEGVAATVCGDDPRTRSQRRADALIALTTQQTRLQCGCGSPDCPATGTTGTAAKKPLGEVVIHVLADQATVNGQSQAPGYLARIRGGARPAAARAGHHGHGQTAADPAAAGRRAGVSAVRHAGRVRALARSDVSVSRL